MRETGTTDRQPGSSRPCTSCTSRTAENIDAVNGLVLSQVGAPGTHKTINQIAKETGISRTSVGRIIHSHSAKVPEETSRTEIICVELSVIDQAIDQCRDRLNARVTAKGNHSDFVVTFLSITVNLS